MSQIIIVIIPGWMVSHSKYFKHPSWMSWNLSLVCRSQVQMKWTVVMFITNKLVNKTEDSTYYIISPFSFPCDIPLSLCLFPDYTYNSRLLLTIFLDDWIFIFWPSARYIKMCVLPSLVCVVFHQFRLVLDFGVNALSFAVSPPVEITILV